MRWFLLTARSAGFTWPLDQAQGICLIYLLHPENSVIFQHVEFEVVLDSPLFQALSRIASDPLWLKEL